MRMAKNRIRQYRLQRSVGALEWNDKEDSVRRSMKFSNESMGRSGGGGSKTLPVSLLQRLYTFLCHLAYKISKCPTLLALSHLNIIPRNNTCF